MGKLLFIFSNLAQFPEIFQGASLRWDDSGERFNVGGEFDEEKTVRMNEGRLLERMGAPRNTRLVKVFQEHGATVQWVDAGASGMLGTADALATSASGVALSVRIADCQAVLMFDPVRRVVAAVHSGWRGSVQNIVGRAVEALQREAGTRPSDLWVGVSPSLGPCCARFSDPERELPEFVLRHRVDADRVDFWALTETQLVEAGVALAHVEVARECTACHTDRWFSHRGDRDRPAAEHGRMVAVIGLRSPRASV